MNDAPEEIVAVGLAQDPRRLSELKGFSPRWFSMPECREVYRAARAYHEGNLEAGRVRYASPAALGRAVVERTRLLAERDDGKDKAREREATQRSAERLLDASGGWAHIDEHAFRDAADRVREAAKDAICREGLLRLVDVLKKGETKGLASRLRDLSVEVSAAEPTGSLTGTLAAEAGASLAEYRLAKKTPGAGAIPTPFPRLNACAGTGGRPGRLWMVAAFAKSGKTQCAKELIYHAAFEHGKGALIVTAEQTKADMRTMMVVRHTHRFRPGGIDYTRLVEGRLKPEEEDALREAVEDLRKNQHGPVSYFQAPGGTTVSDIRAVIEGTARRHPVEVVMIDHTMLFDPTNPRQSDTGRVAEVIREAKQLALDYDSGRGLWVIACHQINRDGFEAASKRGYYLPPDLAGSSEAERSADLILWLWRDDKLTECREIKMGVMLNRWGPPEVQGWNAVERFDAAAILPLEDP